MSAAHRTSAPDPMMGHFASIVLALLLSTWMTGLLVDQVSMLFSITVPKSWIADLGAGLFFGTVFANPVGTCMRKLPIRKSLRRFVPGLAFGIIAQQTLFTPLAGSMSTYLMLLSAVIGVLLLNSLARFNQHLLERGIDPKRRLGGFVQKLLGAPDRVYFLAFMGLGFVLLWQYASIAQVVLSMGLILAMLTIGVALDAPEHDYYDDPEEAKLQAWLALEPEEVETDPAKLARARLSHVFAGLLPGAVLFGAMTALTVKLLEAFYPPLALDMNDLMASARVFGMITAGGLAVVLLGMLAALGLSLGVLRLIGHLRDWSPGHLRESTAQLIRLLHFRPISRA